MRYRCDAPSQIQKLQDELVKIKAKPQVVQNIHITQNIQAVQSTVQNIQAIQSVQANVQNIQALQANVQNIQATDPKNAEIASPARVPGWPVPAITPRPFIPASFEITPEMFEHATARVRNKEGCRQGTVEGVAELAMECVKLIQENPAEQNIFLNPSSRDQGLIYVHPPHWEKMPIRDALMIIFTHLAQEIGDLVQAVPSSVHGVAHVAEKALNTKTSDIIQTARPSAIAHLDNLYLRITDKITDSWLGEISTTSHKLRWFGRETGAHLETVATVLAFETMLNVYTAADVTAAMIPQFAVQLPSIYARLVLARHPENLTVRFADHHNHDVYVHAREGWQFMTAETAADVHFRAFARRAVAYIRAQSSVLLVPVATYITEHMDEIVEIELRTLGLLSRYASEASRYYKTTIFAEQPQQVLSAQPATWTDAEIDALIESF